ncbi:hypothetical protein PanWU01x14_349860 [Parasponia andersonii]|uniref:RNase H type-1 domain-containing protein n=1 Tax=Parasponia andersonii TaxID=3476 RepID=A0A2P5AB62_PARAD|nr:hypothetical protein PanWU01x14_349860 [Parasponia andersonii]
MRKLLIIFSSHVTLLVVFGELSLRLLGGVFDWMALIDLWLDALEANFSSQVSQLWRLAIVTSVWVIWTSRNKLLFDNEFTSIHMAITLVWCIVGESNNIGSGTMRNSLEELGILKCLNVKLKPSKAPKIVEVFWRVPPVGWLKVNTDGTTYGCLGLAGSGGIFRTSRVSLKGSFAISIGKAYTFEAGLVAVIHAIFYA